MIHRGLLYGCVALIMPWVASAAQDPQEDAARQKRWSIATDVGLAITDGNSKTESFKVDNNLQWKSERSSFRVKLDGLRSTTTDDRFRQADAGFTWLLGSPPPDVTSVLIDASKEPDVEEYAVEFRFERSVSKKTRLQPGRMRWHTGASWERNLGAGLLGRTSVFGGLGHTWWDREDLRFNTSYGLSWTERDEKTSDPDKEAQFAGLRYTWLYENRWGQGVLYANDWVLNLNLNDTGDYTSSMTQSIRVPMTGRLSLKVKLQWLYSSRPALEDIAVRAQAIVVDPDGTPGTGDEFYQTVASGGDTILLGSVRERKERLDTVLSTSLTVQLGAP